MARKSKSKAKRALTNTAQNDADMVSQQQTSSTNKLRKSATKNTVPGAEYVDDDSDPSTTISRRVALRGLPMPRPSFSAQDSQRAGGLEPYDMFTSIKHDPQKVLAWCRMAERIKTKPTMKQFLAECETHRDGSGSGRPRGTKGAGGFFPPLDRVMGMATFNETSDEASQDKQSGNSLIYILGLTDIGSLILENLYAEGWRAVYSLAVTSRRTWMAVALNTKLWDVLAGCDYVDNRSSIFVATVPEYSIGMLQGAKHEKTSVSEFAKHIVQTGKDSLAVELKLQLFISSMSEKYEKIQPFWSTGGPIAGPEMTSKLRQAVGSLKRIPDLLFWKKYGSGKANQLYQPLAGLMAGAIEALLTRIWKQSGGLKVLYFHSVPMLDRRLVAVMLHGCPRVQTLGIYDCPLIHFGDVISLLDLIWETNVQRQAKGNPCITSFDFYPHYQTGVPYQCGPCATYGITWGPEDRDLVLRGFYAVILKAYLKSKSQSLRLLFEHDKAFVTYLKRVPNLPWGVSQFLDALRRFTSLSFNDKNYKKKRLQVVYDLVAPIRVVLSQDWHHDWPGWFERNQQFRYHSCMSCGYELLSDFFDEEDVRLREPNRLYCAACKLHAWLDMEPDHFKREKRTAIRALFPRWRGLDSNMEAPIHRSGAALIHPDPRRALTANSDHGHGGTGSTGVPLPRLNRIVHDSMQKLPTLSELVGDPDEMRKKEQFRMFQATCKYVDAHCRTLNVLREQWPEPLRDIAAFSEGRPDKGFVDDVHEKQGAPTGPGDRVSFNFETAYQFYRRLFPSNTEEGRRRAAEQAERDFW